MVGRNAPALGTNRASFVAGDSWGDKIGVFKDNDGVVIDLSTATITITILDRIGGATIGSTSGTGAADGTFTFLFSAATTAGYLTPATHGAQRNAYWNCTMTLSSRTVTVWSAVESPLAILAD